MINGTSQQKKDSNYFILEGLKNTSKEIICNDVRVILDEFKWRVRVGRNAIDINTNVKIEVISSATLSYYKEGISLGSHVRIVVALGGVKEIKYGIPFPHICFIQLWYSDGNLITYDILNKFPH